jgi:hypothetical protein
MGYSKTNGQRNRHRKTENGMPKLEQRVNITFTFLPQLQLAKDTTL